MRLTQKLCAQHLGFMFKKHWAIQKKRIVRSTGAIEELEKYGIVAKDALDVITEQKPRIELEIFEKTPVDTSSYVECYNFEDNNVFVEGLQQAQTISKSIVINELPENVADAIKKTEISNNTKKNLHRSILTSFVLDAYQEKLPKVKVPEKPMYNLPRLYGIPHSRKCSLLISKLLFECDNISGPNISLQNKIVNETYFDIFVKKDNNLLRFDLTADTLLLNKQQIKPFRGSFSGDVPNLFPMTYTIGLRQSKVPKIDIQPFNGIISQYSPHTIFSHFIPEKVTNIYKTPVTQNQIEGRTLLKAFVAAYSKAKQLYGETVKELEKPIVVQSIQTDGQQFHFGIFQLNTMDLNESNETKNIWFQTPILHLFDACEYQKARPVLEGLNTEVFKTLNAFYNNS